MHILIVTPLYPPDTASHAPYVKEFATRVSNTHTVTILTYNQIPEKIDGVRIISISKRFPIFFRIIRFWYALWKESRMHEVLYIQNGPSVELPFIFMPRKNNTREIFHLGDEVALCHTKKSMLLRILTQLSCHRSHTCITHPDSIYTESLVHTYTKKLFSCPRPHVRPEILPFVPKDTTSFVAYTESWNAHMHCLENIFTAP